MSVQIVDRGPAFPSNDDEIQNDGMTLRDWFAGQALRSLVTADSMENHSVLSDAGVNDGTYFGREFTSQDYWEDVAKSAYAMLKARGGAS